MSKLTIITPVPFIDTEAVKKGPTIAYILEAGQSEGFNGIVSDVKAEEVTLTGFRKGASATLKLTAEKLKAGGYAAFRYSQNMECVIEDGSATWTKDIDTEMIDPSVCRPGCFIMYRKNESDAYTNGLIVTVEREKMTVSSISSGKSTVVTLTMAEMKKAGFDAEVSQEIRISQSVDLTGVYIGEDAPENTSELWVQPLTDI